MLIQIKLSRNKLKDKNKKQNLTSVQIIVKHQITNAVKKTQKVTSKI